MIILLRTLLVLTYALFFGGLTFYTGVVVRISHDVLSDPMDGGLITQQVTDVLQWLGAATAGLMLMNALAVRKVCSRRFKVLIGCAVVLAIAVCGLFMVHEFLDEVIDVAAAEITDRDQFVVGHRRYNQLTTVEWLATLIYLPVAISAWRLQDQRVA
ncbi:MAG: hypothetical protein AB8G99_17270 [Planctomycetaceae bacterium]